jgi:TonB family protein
VDKIFNNRPLRDKSEESESKELSYTALLSIAIITVVVIALMFVSVFGKGYLSYGGVAFGAMTAIIVHVIIVIISQTKRTTYLLFIHGGIWIVAIVLAVFWRFNREKLELMQYGVVYKAPIIDLYTQHGRRRRGSKQYYARIRYEVKGKVYVNSIKNPERFLELSDTAKIVYSSKDPVLFAVTGLFKRDIPDSLNTAAFEEVGSDRVPITDPIPKPGDRFPSFRGGSVGFYKYIATHLRHPETEAVNYRAGMIRLSFVVDQDGTVVDVRVIQGINQLYDAAAVNVLKGCPKWQPGIRDGKPIKVSYNVPIRFSVDW